MIFHNLPATDAGLGSVTPFCVLRVASSGLSERGADCVEGGFAGATCGVSCLVETSGEGAGVVDFSEVEACFFAAFLATGFFVAAFFAGVFGFGAADFFAVVVFLLMFGFLV